METHIYRERIKKYFSNNAAYINKNLSMSKGKKHASNMCYVISWEMSIKIVNKGNLKMD